MFKTKINFLRQKINYEKTKKTFIFNHRNF